MSGCLATINCILRSAQRKASSPRDKLLQRIEKIYKSIEVVMVASSLEVLDACSESWIAFSLRCVVYLMIIKFLLLLGVKSTPWCIFFSFRKLGRKCNVKTPGFVDRSYSGLMYGDVLHTIRPVAIIQTPITEDLNLIVKSIHVHIIYRSIKSFFPLL